MVYVFEWASIEKLCGALDRMHCITPNEQAGTLQPLLSIYDEYLCESVILACVIKHFE